tara:strand:+ start:413 stop:601 length:189 start_codon:yes stop_codon:yes gene_type:complete
MKQPTLYDMQTIANKAQMMISLTLAQAMEELEKAREAGDALSTKILQDLVDTLINELEVIEE